MQINFIRFIDKIQLEKKQKIIFGFMGLGLVLVLISLFTGDFSVIGNTLIIALALSIVPYFLYRYARFVYIKSLETEFPNFVRDLSDAKRSGMSLPQAIKIASRSNYGKLSIEVRKMHNRLTWGTPFLRVLNIFGESVSESKIINEALNIIRESYQSGGNVASTLEAIARDMVMLKEAEEEKASLVKQNVFIMYAVFFMFMSIAIMIIQVMVPMIRAQPQTSAGILGLQFKDPCKSVSYFPCNLFLVIGSLLALPQGVGLYYVSLFFIVVIIQGIFTGLIAGQLGENSVIAGTKHSFIMVFVSIGIFIFMAKTGLFPV